ncbi:MAG: 50S ribosomal protein L4 [Nanoarchaeota archaeon]|nr:50S ribosomal protein L4 [Nanoarchaeota archaeon]MBU1632776.1 50S ribosomal protein L4 [Nanoarchaeota archaeon]MBU1876384.1 50S ribosomal protein L4 [Nanoarchaeota archaeon]
MKLSIFNSGKKKTGEIDLPSQFSEEYRPDLIKRAVHALQANSRQAYGADPDAGMRSSSKLSKRRRKYRGSYGFGISRVNRKILSRRGTRFSWVGAFSPQTTGGRKAHAPKSEKILAEKVNRKENRKAIRSAMTATLNKCLVEKRGHKVPVDYPFVLNNDIENMEKTKDVEQVLIDLGFQDELKRSLLKKIRAGLGTMRGRKYRKKKSVLIVTGGKCALSKAAKNLSGIDVVEAKELNAELLSPGTMSGRVTLWTENAVKKIAEEKLFR